MSGVRSERAILAKGFLAKGLFSVMLGFKIAYVCFGMDLIICLYVFDLCNMIFSLFLYLVSGLFIVCSVINNIPYFAYVYVVAGIS